MMQLKPGFNEVRWTGATQLIIGVPFASLILRVYTKNRATGTGYIGYTRGDLFPTLTSFTQGIDYLIELTAAYDTVLCTTAPFGVFEAFDGYTPAPATEGATPVLTNGANVLSYPFTNKQVVPITHNLGRPMLVQVFNTNGEQIDGSVAVLDLNKVVVSFSQPLSGTIIIS